MNEAYAGGLLLQKTYRENHINKKKLFNEGQLPQYRVQDSHEAIIPAEQFTAVQAEMQRGQTSVRTPVRGGIPIRSPAWWSASPAGRGIAER